MINLRQYTNQKQKLIAIYKEVMNDVELENRDILDLQQYKENLLKEKFTVSVCGQMNVGKSTFLNDLLFEENILPTREVAETAKLTTIAYGEEPFYEVIFYSEEEWNKLKQEQMINANGEGVTYDDGEPCTVYEYLIKTAVNKSISATGNISIEKEMVDKQPTTGTNFKDLKKYISADGIYTPFVKTANLAYPSELLRDIIVVDTPGTNDPNTVRSKLTEDWIGKSDAVIYLMYGGQALTAQDQEFILKYLLPVPSDKIIIALSKIDTIDDIQRPKNYVENNLRSLEQFQRAIQHKTIYPISPMYSLYPKLYQKYKAGEIELLQEDLEQIEFQLFDRRDKKIEKLIAEKGFMPELREAIETHLLQNKGEAIIASHKQKILSIYESKIRDLVVKKERALKNLTYSHLEIKDILQKQAEIENSINRIEKLEEASIITRDSGFITLQDSIHVYLIEMFDSIGINISRELTTTKLDHIIHNIGWFLKNECEKYIHGEFKENIKRSLSDFKKVLEDLLVDIKTEVSTQNSISTVSIDAMFSNIAYKPIIMDIEQKITKKLRSDILEKLNKNYLKLRFKKKSLAEIEKQINEIIITDKANGLRESIFAMISSNVKKDLDEFINRLFEQIKEELRSVKDYLQEIIDQKVEKETLEEKIKEQIKEYDRQIQSLEKQKSQILSDLHTV